jgi:hypothetical protein
MKNTRIIDDNDIFALTAVALTRLKLELNIASKTVKLDDSGDLRPGKL